MARSDGAGHVPTWHEIRTFAEHAEAIGLDSLWASDHFFGSFPGAPLEGVHEAWTITSALAAATSRVEIGQLVSCASYRPPGLLAKMAVTADEISGGRLVLGLGAGWHDTEYEAFGFPRNHRVSRLEEYLQVVAPLLRGETVALEGRYTGPPKPCSSRRPSDGFPCSSQGTAHDFFVSSRATPRRGTPPGSAGRTTACAPASLRSGRLWRRRGGTSRRYGAPWDSP
jgi:alkanesulfonate monooxygenase SsuD/methylene tetrahydromethanopterin reductase-like flavin-dependent oxidoreductase (luciferase family)